METQGPCPGLRGFYFSLHPSIKFDVAAYRRRQERTAVQSSAAERGWLATAAAWNRGRLRHGAQGRTVRGADTEPLQARAGSLGFCRFSLFVSILWFSALFPTPWAYFRI